MAGIIFYFEDNDRDVYSGRPIDLDAWVYAAMAAGDVDKLAIVNRTDVDLQAAINGLHGQLQIEVTDNTPNVLGEIVRVVTPGEADTMTESIWDFKHDVDWYFFGPAEGHRPAGRSIMIPQSGGGFLHSVHIASVVCLHRFHKLGRN